MTLDAYECGHIYKVVKIGGNKEIYCRLLDLGLTPGTLIKVVGAAPKGDPIRVELRGYTLLLSKANAALVEVE